MKYKVISLTDRGFVRKDNQDTLYLDTRHQVWVVADGMGGGSAGAEASAVVCARISEELSSAGTKSAERCAAVDRALRAATSGITTSARRRGFDQMGSTVAIYLADLEKMGCAEICHVGDSRIYRVRDGKAELLTHDHTIGSELSERAGEAGRHFADRSNPLAHILTRVIGTGSIAKPEWRRIDVQAADRFVICSDGVHDVIPDEDLASVVTGRSLDEAKALIENHVCREGAPDNFSFIILEAEGA